MTNERASATDTGLPAHKKSDRDFEFGTFAERLDHLGALFEINPPEIVYDEDGEPEITEALVKWSNSNNIDANWLFGGNPSTMVHAWARRRSDERTLGGMITNNYDTPILRLFREHRELIEAASRHVYVAGNPSEGEDAQLDRLFYNRANDINEEMMALPCTCAADFAAKTIAHTGRGGVFEEWETGELWREARALVGWTDFAPTKSAA